MSAIHRLSLRVILSFALLGSVVCASANAGEPLYIDVRTAAEFARGALDGALHIPHDQIADRIAAVVPDKSTEIRLYCKSGGRSGMAKRTLEALGYTAVINAGGYEQLKERLSQTSSEKRED